MKMHEDHQSFIQLNKVPFSTVNVSGHNLNGLKTMRINLWASYYNDFPHIEFCRKMTLLLHIGLMWALNLQVVIKPLFSKQGSGKCYPSMKVIKTSC